MGNFYGPLNLVSTLRHWDIIIRYHEETNYIYKKLADGKIAELYYLFYFILL